MNSETGISKSQVLAIAVFNLAEQLQLIEFELALILGLSEAELSLVINEKELEPDTTAGKRAITLINRSLAKVIIASLSGLRVQQLS